MTLSLGLAWLTFRSGLRLRRKRQRAESGRRALRARHLRLAKPAVVLIFVGAVGGPLSSWWLRDWTPFRTFHAWAGLACLLAFAGAALAGRRLERGRVAVRPFHARVALLAVLLGALCAVSGFVLLP